MVFSIRPFQDGFVFGEIGVANLILDHDSGELWARPPRTRRTLRGKQKTEKDVYNVSKDGI
jgi:hypothetical protein